MKLLIDEMWPSSLAAQLRQLGHDADSVVERPALRGQPDHHLMEIAIQEERVIVTENVRDFRRIAADCLRNGNTHPGLILTTNRRYSRHDPRVVGRMVTALDALLTSGADLTNREHWLL